MVEQAAELEEAAARRERLQTAMQDATTSFEPQQQTVPVSSSAKRRDPIGGAQTLAATADQIFALADQGGSEWVGADPNGLLTKNEIKKYLNQNEDLKNLLLQGEGYAALFKELDTDQDGKVTPEEWRSFYTKRIEGARKKGSS